VPKLPDGTLPFLLSVLAVGLLSSCLRGAFGSAVLESVIVLFALSALCVVAFLLGRAHARRRREGRNSPPPPGP
jgi:hypothetical protein